MEWQLIETAPKDGMPILLCDKDGDIYTGRWSAGDWGSVCNCSWAEDDRLFDITHWMPLPKAPQA